ncbi:unnamed protein product, partial [Oikopleura dioica]
SRQDDRKNVSNGNLKKGIVELDLGQNEYKSAAIWEKKIAFDLLKKGPADDGDKLQITDLLQKSAQHHQKASCEQIAAAIYLDAADKLVDTSSAPYYDHFLTEPKLKENNQIKLRSFVEKAANLRNDETSALLLIKAGCFVRHFPEHAKKFFQRAKRISNKSIEVKIAMTMLDLYVGETSTPENNLEGSDEISEVDDIIESIQLWHDDPDAINRLISSVAELGEYAQVKELIAFIVEILIDLLQKTPETSD